MIRELQFLLPFTAALTTWLVIYTMLRRGDNLLLDVPNDRSLHTKPIPRVGGIGIMLGITIASIPLLSYYLLLVLALMLSLFSFLDDRYGLPASLRLLIHFIAASIFLWTASPPSLLLVFLIITALAIAWMVNLYNFMDGADGLAGGMTISGFVTYGIVAWLEGHREFSLLNFSIAASALAFLIFNFHPARVFMGDAGSIPLGFLTATIGYIGWLNHLWPFWFPILVFSPFIVDASVTLGKRLLRGEKVWEAHREHYYQKMVQMGWGHRNTALAEYGLMVLCSIVALTALHQTSLWQITIALIMLMGYVILLLAIEKRWRQFCLNKSL